MMLKVYDLLRSLGWYIISFIYDLIDGLLLVSLKNGTNFSLAYRFMTLEQIVDKTISACKWSV